MSNKQKPFAYLYEHRDCDESTQFWMTRQHDLCRSHEFFEIKLFKESPEKEIVVLPKSLTIAQLEELRELNLHVEFK